MREINSKEFAARVDDRIENDVEVTLLPIFNHLARRFGFEPIRDTDEFETVYYMGGYASRIRDIAIEMFEELGMNIQPDGMEW